MNVAKTTSRRVRVLRRLLLCVLAAALAATACWAGLTFAVGAGSERMHTSAVTSANGLDALTPAGRAYVRGIAAVTFEGLAAMYGTRPVERPMRSAQALRSLGRKERRRVRAITALIPEQVAAAYGTTRP
jgi:TRAP-type C4-dicarboxylate transport system permease small subunit